MIDSNPPLRRLQSALAWSLIGLLLTYGLINLIGFISPFWAVWRYPGDLHASMNLLHAWQPITPWFSLCFLVAGWHLAMAMRSLPARAAVFVLYALVPVAMIGSSVARRVMEQAGTPSPPQGPAIFNMMAVAYLAVTAVTILALAWWILRRSNRSLVAEGVSR